MKFSSLPYILKQKTLFKIKMLELHRRNTRFLVEKIINLIDVWLAGKIFIERWCDKNFQKLHLPYSHILVAWYRLEEVNKVYNNLFGKLKHENID